MSNIEKSIAIKGHKTRGAEVIKILEQLGGNNSAKVGGHFCDAIYFIDNNNEIHYTSDAFIDTDKFQIYTLEEYLESLKQTEERNDKTQRQLSVDIETAKIELPTSWGEFCKQNSKVGCEYYINMTSEIRLCFDAYRDSEGDKILLETQEDAEAILALIQLKRLRDAWWKALNYQPNWTDNKDEKHCIVIYSDEITFETRSYTNAFLAFPTQDYRNQFFAHFKDLILKAKPFLS